MKDRLDSWLLQMHVEYAANTKPFLDILLQCEQYRSFYILTVDDSGKQTIEPGPLPPEVQSLYDKATEGLRYLREDFERRVCIPPLTRQPKPARPDPCIIF